MPNISKSVWAWDLTGRDLAAEYAHCARDPRYFLATYGIVKTRDQGDVPFEVWPHLDTLLNIYLNNDRLAILKARQVGITWFFVFLALWTALFTPNANIVIISRRQQESVEFKNRIKFMWSCLPDFLRIDFDKDNDDLFTLPAMGSQILSLPTTAGSGRSESATLVVFDEWAYQENAAKNLTGVLPIVEHGKLVGISTANGTAGQGKVFYEQYTKAKRTITGGLEEGELPSTFIPIFIPWMARPGRTREWLDEQAGNLPSHMVHQEYPEYETEAFILGGTCMFDVPKLRAMPVRGPDLTKYGADVYHPPAAGRTYTAGMDCAWAGRGGDFTVLNILDDLGNQVARLRSQQPLEEVAKAAFQLLQWYSFPYVAVELQGQGLLAATVFTAKQFYDGTNKIPYPRAAMYYRDTVRNHPGWYTSKPTRDKLLGDISIALRTGNVTIHASETVEEFLGFGYNDTKNRYEAMTGHDDEVISLGLAHQMRILKTPKLTTKERDRPGGYISYLQPSRGSDVDWSTPTPTKADWVTEQEAESPKRY